MRYCSAGRAIATRLASKTASPLRKAVPPRARKLCTKAPPGEKPHVGKVHDTAPPPPPPGQGGGGGLWIILTAALAGGGYYFKDEISEFVGMGGKKATENNDLLETAKGTNEVKAVVEDAEKKLEAVIKQEKANTPTTNEKSAAQTAEVATVVVSKTSEADWAAIREEISDILESENFDDGSYGPILVRLAWHSAGTYNKKTGKGGTEGAAMRFHPEMNWGANAGLKTARDLLEPIKAKHPEISYSDLWSFAGTVAIEEMGGPEMKWRGGRKDYIEGKNILEDGLLPDADGREHKSEPAKHIRFIFNRMGFNDQEMVALIGAHALGRCHTTSSGYDGPWTRAPTTFSNEFFRLLIEEKWTKKQWDGPEQYEDSTGALMMLPSDIALIEDPKFKKYTELYAKDEDKFFKDFAKAWMKLQENGVKKFNGWRKYILFGPRV